MTYLEACNVAQDQSKTHQCTQYVTCEVLKASAARPEPTINPTGYRVDDFYDGSVVAQYTNGREF